MVTPFSAMTLNVVYSVMPLLLRKWNAFWPFEDCYLLGFVFVQFVLLPKSALYEDIKTCISANKPPLFHSRLGSPASFFSSTPVPRSRSTRTVTALSSISTDKSNSSLIIHTTVISIQWRTRPFSYALFLAHHQSLVTVPLLLRKGQSF